ncbi:MAG: EAL domain-containing protein [Gemmatimonadetes bacterium]|nr:EAL domain-containing protein [Gemmatimonadota bacterium]
MATASASTAPTAAAAATRRVLVIDDEPAVLKVLGLVLQRRGFSVETLSSAKEAIARVPHQRYHAILTDIIMPEMTGVEFLRELRRHDLDVPVILMTAGPTLDSAIEAIEYGAQQYLLKPVEPDALVRVVGRAVALGELARAKRDALTSGGRKTVTLNERADLEASLTRAFDTISIAFQPIVSMKARTLVGYEALMRCDESLFASYHSLLAAAERVAWRPILARTIYQRIAAGCSQLPEGALLFVNVHPFDAQEGLLTGSEAPLEPLGRNIVLDVSDQTPLERIDAFANSVHALRGAGYRIAIDDLGTGASGLRSFTKLSPDFVKLDRSVYVGVETDDAQSKVARAMFALCRELGVPVIAECVETATEREALRRMGADMAQGRAFGAPASGFTTPQF